MAILSRQAIADCLATGRLQIEPSPREEDFDSDAVDVHLGETVYEWVPPARGTIVTIALWRKSPDDFRFSTFAKDCLRQVPPDNAGIVTLRPHCFYLADLQQFTALPPDLAMHVNGKSSLARLGILVHLTAPHAHAGWRGRLTLEIYNLGPFNIEMKPGMVIGQLTFWRVEAPAPQRPRAGGQFDDQQSARGRASDSP